LALETVFCPDPTFGRQGGGIKIATPSRVKTRLALAFHDLAEKVRIALDPNCINEFARNLPRFSAQSGSDLVPDSLDGPNGFVFGKRDAGRKQWYNVFRQAAFKSFQL
jgi:hypothetical protein